MILIDSLHITGSGGLLLLKYLLRSLDGAGKDFFLLADLRCQGVFDEYNVTYLRADHKIRKHFYVQHKKFFSSVICFGNIPPLIKLDVPVYTYFHNINLLTLQDIFFFKWKVRAYFKRLYFRWYKNNTDYWIVQTLNTKNELIKHLHESVSRVKIIPFYDIPNTIKEKRNSPHGDDYALIGNYTGSKGHDELLKAWEILHNMGFNKTLHLTVREGAPIFPQKIKRAQEQGINVKNHGIVPFESIGDIYLQAKAIIYPSMNESLGLGIIEAIYAGCDIIGSDLPFIHSICKPSGVFDPKSPESIAEAVIAYEENHSDRTVLTISNGIEELISLLV